MNRNLRIGEIIAQNRKRKGITQEELAAYLGVSKPAVSKWESGQSFPDILLLPQLASFFSLSVDKLLGYEAQMSKEDIRKFYRRLADKFADGPFEDALAECRETVKTYYSCWELLFAAAQLLVNHAALQGEPERINAVLEEASGLFERVEQESGDPALASRALSMRAYCSLALQKPAETIDLIGGIEEPVFSTDVLLAKAYAMKGDIDKTKSLLQGFLYRNLVSMFGTFPELVGIYAADPAKTDECLQKAEELGAVFGLKEMHPALYFSFYLAAAAVFAAQKRNDRALDVLEQYEELLSHKNIFPLKLQGNEFFDRLAPMFESNNLGTSVPRSQKLIVNDLKNTVLHYPAFQSLAGEERYQALCRRISHWEVNI